MRIGSLFSGVGGLDLAVEAVTGGTTAWQSEVGSYASAVLRKRFPDAPNLGDITTMVDPPAVDVVCGGFPCQDVSSAGKREGLDGQKSGLWREMARVVCRVRPRLVFVENVSTLAARGLGEVLGDLAGLGFDAEWTSVLAADVGAPHRRNRVFILAYQGRDALRVITKRSEQRATERGNAEPGDDGGDLANPVHDGRGSGSGSEAHDDHWRDAQWNDAHGRDAGVVFPPGPEDGDGWVGWVGQGRPAPGVHRSAYGPPRGVDARRRRARLRCLGNAVVPRQAAAAYAHLAERGLG